MDRTIFDQNAHCAIAEYVRSRTQESSAKSIKHHFEITVMLYSHIASDKISRCLQRQINFTQNWDMTLTLFHENLLKFNKLEPKVVLVLSTFQNRTSFMKKVFCL